MQNRRTALLVSAALHVLGLLALWYVIPRQTKPPPLPPVQLALKTKPKEEAPKPPPPAELPKKKRVAPVANVQPEEPPPAPEVPETPVEKPEAPRADSPRNDGGPVKLVMPSFLQPERPGAPAVKERPIVRGDDGIDDHTRATERLATLFAERSRNDNAKKKGVDARTQQIALGIQNAFNANVQAVQQKLSPRGAIANGIVTAFEQWQRDMPKGMIGNAGSGLDDGSPTSERRKEKARTDYNMCLGACGTVTHEIARLSTRIEIDHDELGRPTTWRIERSSGQRVFDEDAIESVQLALGCMKTEGHHVLFCKPLAQSAKGPVPKQTHWILHGIVNKWSHLERALDPQFKPTGRHIESGPFSGYYLDSAVELVELAYWDVASQPVPN